MGKRGEERREKKNSGCCSSDLRGQSREVE